MEQLFNFFSNGQQRRTALDELFAGLERYVPPNLRPAVETVAEMNPVQGQMNAMTAGGVVFDPDQTAEARRRAALDMGVEMALALTPAALAARGYLTPIQGVMEGLLGGSPAQQQIAEDAGKLAADASGLARSAMQLDPDMLGEIFQPAGEARSAGAASRDAPSVMKAYHGTPHEFDRFDITKIGTGEGAQAYGHGLYFAENERIAKHYKDKLTGMRSGAVNRILDRHNGDIDAAIEYTKGEVARLEALPDSAGSKKQAFIGINKDALDDLQHIASGGELRSGQMYEVDISASPDDFVNYDARLDEQSDLVKSVLGTGEEVAGARLKRAYDNELFGGDMIGQDRATPTEVSQGLLDKGIKGIRYLDASSRGMGYKINLSRKGQPYETDPIEVGSRREAEALSKDYQEKGFDTNIEAIGNRNMVVFDDRLVEIVRKYGIAGAAALLGVSSADIEGALAQGMPDQREKGLLD